MWGLYRSGLRPVRLGAGPESSQPPLRDAPPGGERADDGAMRGARRELEELMEETLGFTEKADADARLVLRQAMAPEDLYGRGRAEVREEDCLAHHPDWPPPPGLVRDCPYFRAAFQNFILSFSLA